MKWTPSLQKLIESDLFSGGPLLIRPPEPWSDQDQVLCAGVGRHGGGLAAINHLLHKQIPVSVCDRLPTHELKELLGNGYGQLKMLWGENDNPPLEGFSRLVINPAFAPHHPLCQAAADQGLEILTEMTLWAAQCDKPVVAVTGSDGKSTTTYLIHHFLKSQFNCVMGGNMGLSLLHDDWQAADLIVIECSSFQLHYLAAHGFSPDLLALTNLGDDHQDWHGSLKAYHRAKTASLCDDSTRTVALTHQSIDHVPRERIRLCDEFWKGQSPVLKDGVMELEGMRFTHSLLTRAPFHQNLELALCVGLMLEVPLASMAESLSDFIGLPHRYQQFKWADERQAINDSKATTPQSARAALKATPDADLLLLGGNDKAADLKEWIAELNDHPGLKVSFGPLGQRLRDEGLQGGWHDDEALTTLEQWLPKVNPLPHKVLLSPGGSSFDRYQGYDQRGEDFMLRLGRC